MRKEGSEDSSQLVSRGTSGSEAEDFIVSIHKVAQSAGRIRDNLWTADLAVPRLASDALRWYAKLDEEVQADWRLLRRAILREYSSDNLSRSIERWVRRLSEQINITSHTYSSDQERNLPTAAAAFPPASSLPVKDKIHRYHMIRVYFNNRASKYALYKLKGIKVVVLTRKN